jgi:hypothetical protein
MGARAHKHAASISRVETLRGTLHGRGTRLRKVETLEHRGDVKLVNCQLLLVAGGHEVSDELGRAKGQRVHVVSSHAVDELRLAHRAALRLCLGRRLPATTQTNSELCHKRAKCL